MNAPQKSYRASRLYPRAFPLAGEGGDGGWLPLTLLNHTHGKVGRTTLPLLARQWELSAYDAAYLQLALARKAPLVTLDSRLAKAYDQAAARSGPS